MNALIAAVQPDVLVKGSDWAAEDVVGYTQSVESVLDSFETREEYLEDIPVADTVLARDIRPIRSGTG